jgi:hypothetical protein
MLPSGICSSVIPGGFRTANCEHFNGGCESGVDFVAGLRSILSSGSSAWHSGAVKFYLHECTGDYTRGATVSPFALPLRPARLELWPPLKEHRKYKTHRTGIEPGLFGDLVNFCKLLILMVSRAGIEPSSLFG